ncbi:hypothetical protein [Pseudomonas sp. RT6P73]
MGALLFLRTIAAVAALCLGGDAWAAPQLQIKFHMGLSYGATQVVGGTLVNLGDAPVYRGYLIVTPINAQCRPGTSVLHAIGAVQSGEEQQFRVPVPERFSRYRLQVGAFDEQGFIVPATDAGQTILDGRLKEEREECNKFRND